MAMYAQYNPNIGAARTALDQMAGSRAMANMAGPGRKRPKGMATLAGMAMPNNQIDPLFGVPVNGTAAMPMPAYGQPALSNRPMPRGEGAMFGAGRAQRPYTQMPYMGRDMPARMDALPLPTPGRIGRRMPTSNMAAGPSDMAMVRLRELLMKRPTRGFIR